MLFSESWLRSYIDPAMDTDALCEAMTMAGLEVEEVAPVAPAFSGIVVARVLTCVDHENSDHLHVCTVDVGEAEPVQIVCGAPNVRAGVLVPCAKIGAVLPGDFKIKKAKMRGVESFGMLCSARELGITEDHSGLWILPEGLTVGEDIRTACHLDDKKIEIKLTPNRGDALSLIGVARDLHAVTGAELHMPKMDEVPATCECTLPVEIEATDLCGRFTGRVIRGLNAKAETPQWMKDRLERSGQRSINALVDISNYVMLELGRPSHFFDLNKLKGDKVVVRWAREGESCALLNGQTVQLDPYFGVVCDGDTPECLAGIMGGEASSISLETTDLFVEAAFWHQEKIQGRCRRLNFSTDAAHRFERGVDFGSNADHMHYITKLIVDICGTEATKVGPVVDQIVNVPQQAKVQMRADRARKIIGMPIETSMMAECFTRLGFEFTLEDEVFTVTSPTYRFDIQIEEDLIEEVARLYGYEKLPDVPPMAEAKMVMRPEGSRIAHDIRMQLADMGYQELINFSFVPEAWEKDFADNDKPIRLLNPIASQLSVMRTQMIGGLVDILKYNLNRKVASAKLFEVGRVFYPDESVVTTEWSVKGVRQPVRVAGLLYGDAAGEQWGEKARLVDFFDGKGDVERLIAPKTAQYVAKAFPALHPGRSAAVIMDGVEVGFVGELHPKLQQAYGLPHAPIVFELDMAALLTIDVPWHASVSKFQPVQRDISVMVPAGVSYEALQAAVTTAAQNDPRLATFVSLNLFDLYRPEGATDASLAFRMTLQPMNDEFTGEDADNALSAAIEALEAAGAVLRK
ncbi:MAG: phenylalanine--tRNA ligase subunit beta [Burkholderiaceae bacterium]|nr:phenylalanine--tRNA ligase subunit beta [Burkholderiaceae bacterium]